MFRTRSRKILRDVLSRKFRTLMVSVSIFVGVLGVITLFTVNDLLVSTLERDIDPDKLAMINVAVTIASDAEVDNEAYLALLNQQNELGQSIPELYGIERVEGVAEYPVGFKKPGDESGYEDAFIKAYSTPLQDRQLEPVELRAGEWPVAGQNQITLEKRMAEEYGFDVGDAIVFRQVSDTGVREVEYAVVGLVYHPYIFDDAYPEISIYAQYEDAQAILGFTGFSNFAVRYKTFQLAEPHREDIQQVIDEQTAYKPVYALMEDPAENRAIQNTKSTGNILSMLAVVAMVVSGFLVVNVINSIVVEQKRQIGVIKSLGGTTTDNFFIYAGMAFVYGLIGTIPAVVLGIPLGYQITKGLGKEFGILIDSFDWSPVSVVGGILMGLAVPVLAAAIPVFNGTRVSIISAMTDLGISSNYGSGRLERFVGHLPIPISVRQAFSNTIQKKGRLLLTGITLTLAIGAFMGVLAMTLTLIDGVNAIFDRMNYQIVIIPAETQDQNRMETLIQEVEGVKAVSPTVDVLAEIEGDYTNFFTNDNQIETLGIDPSANTFNFSFTSGDGWKDDPKREGVVIASPVAGQLGLKAGDEITFRIGGKSITMPVIGVDEAAFDFMYMEWTQLATLTGFVTPDGAPVPNAYSITITEPDPSADEVDVVVDRLEEKLLSAGITGSSQNQIALNEEITGFISVFRNIMLFAALLIALVGAVGLLTTLSMNVFERQKEIGVMRSIGASSLTIATQFLSEGMVVGLIAWVIGLPISYWLAVTLNSAFQIDTLEFNYPLNVPVIGLVSMILITLISSLGPSMGAARKTVSDILRYQ
jgi:putative ABC transport system permease protein